MTLCSLEPGGTFAGYGISHWSESTQIGNLLKSDSSIRERQKEEFSGTFNLKFACYQNHRDWRVSKCSVIIKGLTDKLPTGVVQTRYLQKAVSSDVIYFSSGKSFLSSHRIMCRSSQDLVHFLYVSCESKSLLGVWWHKGWLAIGAFPVRLKRVLLEVFLSNRQNIQIVRHILGHHPPRVH